MKKVLLSLAVCLAAAPAGAVDKMTFALNWFPTGDHTAFRVAEAQGYYAASGLDVAMETSKGSGDVIAKVDTGRADAGLADAAVVIAARSRGAKVRLVGLLFDKTPLNFFSRADAPLRTPADLVGKTIGAPPGDGQRQVWPAFAKLAGIDPNAVTWVNVEPAAKIAALAEKRVDAVGEYVHGRPVYEKAMGPGGVADMPWAKFGFEMYSLGIIASESAIDTKAPALRAFLEASYKGLRDTMQDRDAALALYKKMVPEIDAPIIAAVMALGLELMKTDSYVQHGLGWIDEHRMCGSVEIVNAYMGLPNKVACADVYTAKLLPRVDPPPSFR